MSRFRSLVLCYHAISDGWNHALAVGPRAFERQVQTLRRRGYRGATAAEVLAGSPRRLHVTFDDAYTNIERALPSLERLGLPATVFACADYADDGRPLAVPELAADAERQPGELATMRWDELRALVERGVEIGSHTLDHPRLTTLSDSELDRQLVEAKRRIEDELGRRCPFLAYPYGDVDERVHAAARRAGYDGAFALPGRTSPLNLFAIPRVGIYRNSLAHATLKTAAPVRRLRG